MNSSDFATVCAIICRVAASSPVAISTRLPTAVPVSATPKPVTMSPVFSMLEYAMTRDSRFCTAACAMPSSAVTAPSTSTAPTSQPGARPSRASVRHMP